MNGFRFQGLSQPVRLRRTTAASARRIPLAVSCHHIVPLTPLPIDSHIERIRAALDRHRAAVLTAAPGAGKTTRVPPALTDRGRVLLLQPRRVAARAMADRIATERGWKLGHDVGWHIRFERNYTAQTRVVVVTEGILTAYLEADPLLSGVTTLILDEFHERNVHADLGLALAKQAWLARDDLRILIMSATLDSGPPSSFLHGCPVIDVPGTVHPVETEYGPSDRPDEAVSQVLRRTERSVLYFLPGRKEIADALGAARQVLSAYGYGGVTLHGSISAGDQADVLRPTQGRRVIFTTNIAETSLTVPDIGAVIDSGLRKAARYDPARAVDSLVTERISADSAGQRAGRAGRLGPGLVRRLWDPHDRLHPHREAEIHRIDLSSALLAILASGADPGTFEWFEQPSPDRIGPALELLARLGAVDNGRINDLGRLMQRLPLPTRLARILVEARGAHEACMACAWLSESGLTRGDAASTASDLLPILDRWQSMPPHLIRLSSSLAQISAKLFGHRSRRNIDERDFRRALLAGYPDRVARRRSAQKVTLASGHGAVMGRESGVHDAQWLIALDVIAGRTTANTEAIVRVASRIEPEWLQATRSDTDISLDESGTVRARAIDYYDELILAERPAAVDHATRAAMLAKAWLDRPHDDASARLLARLAFAGLDVNLGELVTLEAASARTVNDIVITEGSLPWDARRQLAVHAPDKLAVPSGREHVLEYGADGAVSISVKLQELFGLAETPLLGPNRVPVTVHLLAPNGRPVQTTRDLRSFWERTYPEVRKELRGRYPKHPWPEDPWNATPTHRAKPRAGR